jgi:hypothetical protein
VTSAETGDGDQKQETNRKNKYCIKAKEWGEGQGKGYREAIPPP